VGIHLCFRAHAGQNIDAKPPYFLFFHGLWPASGAGLHHQL
jgi:ribonuclease I